MKCFARPVPLIVILRDSVFNIDMNSMGRLKTESLILSFFFYLHLFCWACLPMQESLTVASCRKDWKRISTESSVMFTRRPNRSRDWTELNFCWTKYVLRRLVPLISTAPVQYRLWAKFMKILKPYSLDIRLQYPPIYIYRASNLLTQNTKCTR